MFTQEFVDKFGLQDFFNDEERFEKVIVKQKRSFGYKEEFSEDITIVDGSETTKKFVAYRFKRGDKGRIYKEIKKLILEKYPQPHEFLYDNESDKQFNTFYEGLFEVNKEAGFVNSREEWDEHFKSNINELLK